ncbi:type VII secretion integral membrane protein EccD [Streptomyces sp. NBC_01476]|uniref:type VII secretion integral membrane protein EccD n=1 Tax=Streptomyces sp. NBC_01476 TaxID=2903881 RepID=UPI002E36F2FC|nr:type VII secretion integral membrane protein EccD [Streptomyces sp. NBC_01476]
MSEGSVASLPGAAGLSGLCRLTVRAPATTLDLAVPSDIPVADLLPVIVGHAGDELPEAGLEHGGWALQRIGGPPLDPEGTPQSLELRDGEVLLLRPLSETLPPVRFDNLVDGVSSTIRGLPHSWSPAVSRWSLRAVLLAVLTAALVLLALSGGDRPSRAALAAGAALLALAGAGAAARVLDDLPGAVLLGLVTGPFAALCGALAVGGADGATGAHLVGARWLAASAAWGIATALALTVVAAYPVAFVPSIVVALAGVIGSVLMLAMSAGLDEAGAAVAVPAVIFGAFVPMLSFSLSGLKLPPLPTNAEQLQEGIDPYPSEEVTARTKATDHWMTGLYAAVGVICAACLAGLAHQPRTPQLLAGGLLALVLLLHGRNLGNAWQRLALVLPGALGAVLLTVCAARQHGADGQFGAVAALLAVGVGVTVVSWTVPGRRLLPYWGRAGDLLQSAAAIGLLPSVLWVLDVYADLRGIKG